MTRHDNKTLFIDSGAFSAKYQDTHIDVQNYIKFIKEHINIISLYANLDVIGDAEQTWENQKIMEDAGLNPIPVFHYGENFEWLEMYLKKQYDYIAIGGLVGGKTSKLMKWLDFVWNRYLCGSNGLPVTKIHGFGITIPRLVIRYPWYSVDSSSWATVARMGAVIVPKYKKGEWIYNEQPWMVGVTARSPYRNTKLKHFNNLPKKHKEIIKDYIHTKGYKIGKSHIEEVSQDYKPKGRKETWYEKHKLIEVIDEAGLSNDHEKRNEINILYYQDLAQSLPQWPWPFVKKCSKGFLL